MSTRFKLLALDMDGTLLDGQDEISEVNRQAIAKAREQGVHIVLSTGRSIATCRPYAESLQLNSYLVTVNGSEVWDDAGNLLERHPLHLEDVEKMRELSRRYQTRFWAVTSERVWRNQLPTDLSSSQWLKFGFDFDDDGVRTDVLEQLSENPRLEITNSSPMNMEVNAVGVHKARGLETVCRRLGLSMDQVMAMGDSLNDIRMIKEAGLGIAMGNAQDVVKEAADWVTGTNEEDGVAQAIRYWLI